MTDGVATGCDVCNPGMDLTAP